MRFIAATCGLCQRVLSRPSELAQIVVCYGARELYPAHGRTKVVGNSQPEIGSSPRHVAFERCSCIGRDEDLPHRIDFCAKFRHFLSSDNECRFGMERPAKPFFGTTILAENPNSASHSGRQAPTPDSRSNRRVADDRRLNVAT